MKSFFRYPGAKVKLTPEYEMLWPDHKHFVDVFGGSGAVILNKHRSFTETFNDIDPAIVSLFRVVRDGKMEDLKHMVRYTPNRSRRMYEEARSIVQHGEADPVRAAWAWLYLTADSITGQGPSNCCASHWGFHRGSKNKNWWAKMERRIDIVHSRFREVQLTNWSWERVLNGKCRNGAGLDSPTTLFFLDPCYYPLTMPHTKRLYRFQMSVQDHQRMLEKINHVQGFVFLCGYPHKDYDDALPGWYTRTWETKTNMHMRGQATERMEKVWMNYDPQTGKRIRSLDRSAA